MPTANNVELEANRRTTLTIDRLVYTGSVNVFDDPTSMGAYTIPAQPSRGIWMGLSTDADRSGGPNTGRIYVAFADQGDLDGDSTTGHDDTDIFVIASDDDGTTWGARSASAGAIVIAGAAMPILVRVNDDTTNRSQFFSWLGVDQSTGDVAVSWYDARLDDASGPNVDDTDGTANNDVHYFGTISFDGGETWMANEQVSDAASTAAGTGGGDYGDYTGLAFLDGVVHMTWADNSSSTGDNPDGANSLNDARFGKNSRFRRRGRWLKKPLSARQARRPVPWRGLLFAEVPENGDFLPCAGGVHDVSVRRLHLGVVPSHLIRAFVDFRQRNSPR